MRTEFISHCFIGQTVKLSPKGKVWAVRSIVRADSRNSEHGKYGTAIEVIDNKGRTRQISYGKRVYLVNLPPEPFKVI